MVAIGTVWVPKVGVKIKILLSMTQKKWGEERELCTPYYFPVGFVFFMTHGPMAEKNFHVTSLCL